MNKQNKPVVVSQEDILKLLQQVKVDFDKVSKQVKMLKAQQEIEEFFTDS